MKVNPEIMLYWQENWKLGMTLSCLIVIIIYIGISLLCLFKTRKYEGDVCCSSFIPIVNIIQFLKYRRKYFKKLSKMRLIQEISEEEIEL